MLLLGCAAGIIALLPVYLKHMANRRAAAQALPELVKKTRLALERVSVG